jgi:hypothetical protein
MIVIMMIMMIKVMIMMTIEFNWINKGQKLQTILHKDQPQSHMKNINGNKKNMTYI